MTRLQQVSKDTMQYAGTRHRFRRSGTLVGIRTPQGYEALRRFAAHEPEEIVEQVLRIVGTGRGFRMVLDRERR
jgi:hypothetical protein